MSGLPNQVNFNAASGGTWTQTFQITGTDLTGLDWEFVIRPTVVDTTQPAPVHVTTTPGTQGQITVDVAAGTVQVVLTPAATALLGRGAKRYALWSNPGLASAIPWCEGVFNINSIAAA